MFLASLIFALAAAPIDAVQLMRVPNGGLQPELAVDAAGAWHMVYLAGPPASADVFYVRSADNGRVFSDPVRVNSVPGSAIATGTVRGAHLAVGRGGRVHVAWNGSGGAGGGMAMLYTRSDPERAAFEPQRNLMMATQHLDGGGSIAADDRGGVYVAWHANASGQEGEQARRVWLAVSTDDGATFTSERAISDASTGACGCCALRLAAAPRGELRVLYRSAREKVHRDIYALVSIDRGTTFTSERLHGWEIGACPMTSMSIEARLGLHAWETDGQVYFAESRPAAAPVFPPIDPGVTPRRKHPRLAVNAAGTVLLVWADGTAWNRGGSVAWQAFSRDGRPTVIRGTQEGIPPWSFAAVVARPDGGFVMFY